jgi:hypothetical protein
VVSENGVKVAPCCSAATHDESSMFLRCVGVERLKDGQTSVSEPIYWGTEGSWLVDRCESDRLEEKRDE